MNAQQRRAGPGAGGGILRVVGAAGFLLPDECGQGGKAHVGVDVAGGVEDRLAEAHEAKAAALLRGVPRRAVGGRLSPADGAADAAAFAFDHFLQARQAVRAGVFAHFDADPAPPHLVRHRRRGAGAEEGVEDEVAGVGGDVEDALEQAFGFWGAEYFTLKKCNDFFFCVLRVAHVLVRPPRLRDNTLFHF